MRRHLLVEKVGDVGPVIARLHHDLARGEHGLRVVDQIRQLLLDRRGLVRALAGPVHEEVGEVVADGDGGVVVRDGLVGELRGGLLGVPL